MGSKSRKERYYGDDAKEDFRGPFERDRDRVLYSSAFRRLAGVTQVAAVSEQRVLHNRLTHSLKVAQLGRRIAQHLVVLSRKKAKAHGVHPDVVETAGLAHDIGHPPFGHIAEDVLDKRLGKAGVPEGFEGNAQSFRLVTKLARRRKEHPGLNLTRASLSAILKYPRTRADKPRDEPYWTDRSRGAKWGSYESEAKDFAWARQGKNPHVRCANAVLMDWADDITYATHDIEDYFRAGLIPLHDLARDADALREHGAERLAKNHHGFSKDAFGEALNAVLTGLNGQDRTRFWETRENRAWLNGVTSANLTELVDAAQYDEQPPYVVVDRSAQYLVEALKELTWFYVIDRPALAMVQEGQKKVIGNLFDELYDCLDRDPHSHKVPVMLRELYQDARENGDETCCARAVADYICLLTEGQAIDLGERMNGTTRSSMFGAWFH
ncbi:dGTPase [Amycolatopsis xylanica]|uniref:dGTPase n=1 Tax=Amycolatopsis xylanica TaxID=589385 RepID=A0A1H3S0Y2_9PSEU|nr:dNTP triphosphohydrolase [Amycolatopsis xylanica]SDZ31666.1 dGTPase [Amycolatopsis xylanica]